MDSTSNFEGLALRFAPYVEDLHAFFVTSDVAFGDPTHLVPFAARLVAPGRFQDDMTSITRSIIYRENTDISMVELLGLLVVAVGGPQADHSDDDLREPVGQLIGFTRTTFRSLLRRPSDDPRLSEIGNEAAEETSSARRVAAQQTTQRRVRMPERTPEVGGSLRPARLPGDTAEQRPVQFTNVYARAQAWSAEVERLAEAEVAPASEAAASPETLDEIASFRIFVAPEPAVAEVPLAPPLITPVHESTDAVRPPKWPLTAPSGARRQTSFLRRSLVFPVLGASILAVAATVTLRHRSAAPAVVASASPRLEMAAPLPVPTMPAAPLAAPAVPVAAAGADPASTYDPAADDDSSPSVAADAPASAAPGEVPAAASRPPAATVTHTARLDRASSPQRLFPAKPANINRVLVSSSGVMSGHLLTASSPDYPKLAGLAHVEGQVLVQAVVGRNGEVTATRVLRGSPLLRGAAEHAIRRWRFRPYLVEGHPAEIATIVTLDFRLHH